MTISILDMLSTSESVGLKNILSDISDDELFSLLETVTKRMFSTRIRPVAVEKILLCTGKPLDLLRRQKVTKKILFNYLVRQGVQVSAGLGKPALVKKCLEFWGSFTSCDEKDFMDLPDKENNLCTETVKMGVAFSQWFFQILNTLNGFGPEHFWPNCSLWAQLKTSSDFKEVSISGANDVANFLCNLIMIDKYYFDANESENSIMLEEEQHGLLKIIIHGVLHQNCNCVGVFNSAFGLVRNPEYQNTYKIQFVKVRMQVNSSVPTGLPASDYLPICQPV